MFIDPITSCELEEPYLASDGITYSRDALLHVMRSDEWHRSPVTREVLRPLAYPNVLVADAMGQRLQDPTEPLVLYDSKAPIPINGYQFTSTLPTVPSSVFETLVHWQLDETDKLTITVTAFRDSAQTMWLMHPPPPEEMWHDAIALAAAFGLDKLVSNPWCLTTATLSTGCTVEDQWRAARSGTFDA